MPIEVLVAFFSASVLLGMTPGQDNIFVLIHSAIHGRLAGILVTLGLCTGLIVHTIAASIGLAVLFKISPIAFVLLKSIGAVYLIYLSINSFRNSAKKISLQKDCKANLSGLYYRGIIMNVTNPNVSLFFIAFLPQFIKYSYGLVFPQFILLGGLFILATLLVFGIIVFFAGSLGSLINRSEKTQRVLNWIAGTVFAGIAVKLVFTKQL